MYNIKNHNALITGASSGIGNAIALGLAKSHCNVCLTGRNAEKLNDQKKLISRFAPKVLICQADLTDEKDIRKVTDFVLTEFGSLHILIHGAGFLATGTIETETLEGINQHFKVNFTAPYLLTQKLLPSLIQTKGQIVFINSSAIQRTIPNLTAYASSKHALKELADSIRAQVNSCGVRVLSIYPGQTATPMQQQLHQKNEKAYHPERLLQPQDICQVVLNSLTLSKSAEITDIYIRPMCKGS